EVDFLLFCTAMIDLADNVYLAWFKSAGVIQMHIT
ncbi:MAG: hypothetical protein ACJAQ6_000208, partial [Arenicella sp.]